MPESKRIPQVVGDVYLHVSNSGVTFKVVDDQDGPHVVIAWSAFSNLQSELKIATTKEGLQALARLFDVATKREYEKPFCCEARVVCDYEEAPDVNGKPVLVEVRRPSVECSSEDSLEMIEKGIGND